MSIKNILGLDIGTTSIGWAIVKEDSKNKSNSSIVKLGVRVNPLTTDEQTDFEKGRPLSVNADRTLKRSARRNLQRFKLRRKQLIELLKEKGFIEENSILSEDGKNTKFETLKIRAKAVKERIKLEEFSRVLLTINRKRGYKSSRKISGTEEGTLIDGMDVAKVLYDSNLTPGQYVNQLLLNKKKYIPDFYQSDLKREFKLIWDFQKKFYPEILTTDFYEQVQDQGKVNTSKLFLSKHQIYTAENKGKEVKLQHYRWRTEALNQQLKIEEVAYVLVEINNNLSNTSGYLGKISDRSKKLYFENLTVGEYLYNQVKLNEHAKLKNQVFYRQDYLDEFEKIWETQAKYHPELTDELKQELRDVIIFYQRRLKSQKHLVTDCEFEKYHKAVPKSSPLFQEFKIWQIINNLQFTNDKDVEILDIETKEALFNELNSRGKLSNTEVLSFCGYNKKEWQINYEDGVEGNSTNQSLYNVYQEIANRTGHGADWAKKDFPAIQEELKAIFTEIGIDPKILDFDAELTGNDFDKQKNMQLWHLLYSFDDNGKTTEEERLIYGNTNTKLKQKLEQKFGFKPEFGNLLASVRLTPDYGSLSAKAIRKILPYLKAGHQYSEACSLAKYNHSKSYTAEEWAKRPLLDILEPLKKNSLRNPVVEKILNQTVNVVNQLVEKYGKFDEVRVELARELKKSAKERKQMTDGINAATKKHIEYRKILQKDFGIKNPTRNDIIRYKLYLELENNSFKTLYSNQYIAKDKLFSAEIDIEHIIPQSKYFDDSFSNKTLEFRDVNLIKGNMTAIDYITNKHSNELATYKMRLAGLQKNKSISGAKYNKLLWTEADIPTNPLESDLRNTQYIAKKAIELLKGVFRDVSATSGSVTDKLRQDWGLIDVMKELNLPKYKAIDESLITQVEKKDGSFKTNIKDWSKRNDHRHHAMDALTVAFTKPSYIQYFNHLNAKSELNHVISNIKTKEMQPGTRKFLSPTPNFRETAKLHIEDILISFKTKNKVVTKNKNKTKIKGKDNFKTTIQLTPRGQLHKETIYGKSISPIIKIEKINAKFDADKIKLVCNPIYQNALLQRLTENDNNPKKAFAGKNSLDKTAIYLDAEKTKELPIEVKIKIDEEIFTIRKPIGPDLKVDKVIDEGIKRLLQKRLTDYKGNEKEAFSNLTENPIWLNEAKGIAIKTVTITGIKTGTPLHDKRNKKGVLILDKNNSTQPVNYVSLGNNHHVAIYEDEKGDLQEDIVSMYEAVARATKNEQIINKNFNSAMGWKFLFTMKQNEMFIFPNDDFDLSEIDIQDPKNSAQISKHLYRVQKLSTRDYSFRHHLDTTTDELKQLKDYSYKRIQTPNALKGIQKVRINHISEIVHIGEY